jgi:hypothetical protein
MSDDLSEREMQDRTRINTNEDYEVRHWSENVVSQEQLKAAGQKVGNSVPPSRTKSRPLGASRMGHALGRDAGCTHAS